ncbi:unnamed protein product, partial [Rotaria sordida]
MDGPMQLLYQILNHFEKLNGIDPIGLFLSLLVSVGHLCAESTVTITNHISKLNLFLLLIGPSGTGKSKIISPIKKAIIDTMKALGISKDDAGIMDDFTNASLLVKLAKTNVFILTDEAEKPLLSLGFYSPLSEISAGDRIAGCKFFGSIPTSKDTMSYHLEINSHLSFVGATTGRLWHRLIHFYGQGYQSDGFSERDDDYETEQNSNHNLPTLSQILIICRLIGKRKFILSRNGTKKFYNKIRQYQELSQIEKPNDVNYGSRMGKSAEILCKLVAVCQILKISMDILKILQDQKQLICADLSFNFIRNVTQIIETKYKSTNIVMEIDSSSCRLAGTLLCSHLLKTLFTLYNTEPIIMPEERSTNIQSISIHSNINTIRERIIRFPQLFFLKRDLTGSMGLLRHYPSEIVNTVLDELICYELIRQGPYVTTTSRGIIHMKSYPSYNILNDPSKVVVAERILNDLNLNLATYMTILCNSTIKEKQVLTSAGKDLLLLPEHNVLLQHLKEKYPERHLDGIIPSDETNESTNTINEILPKSSINNSSINHENSQDSSILSISNQSFTSFNTTSLNNDSNTTPSSSNITSKSLVENVPHKVLMNDAHDIASTTIDNPNDKNISNVIQHPLITTNSRVIHNTINPTLNSIPTSISFHQSSNQSSQETNIQYINPTHSTLSINNANDSYETSSAQTSISTITNILPSSSTVIHSIQQNKLLTISRTNSNISAINDQLTYKNDANTTNSSQIYNLPDNDSNTNESN